MLLQKAICRLPGPSTDVGFVGVVDIGVNVLSLYLG